MKTPFLLTIFFLLSLHHLFGQNNRQPLFEKNFTYPFNAIPLEAEATTIAIADDNTTIFGGIFQAGYPTQYYFYITKIDSSGKVLWSKQYSNGKIIFLNKIRTASDGGYIAVGNSHSTNTYSDGKGKAFMAKLNASGDIEWSREYTKGNVYYAGFEDVRPTKDGGYVASGGTGINQTTDVFVVKTNGKGDVHWSKLFDLGTNDVSRGIVVDGDRFVLTANATNDNGTYKGYLLQLDGTTGNLKWIRRYDIKSGPTSYTTFGEIFKSGSGYVFTAYDGYVPYPNQYVVYTDTKGAITKSFSISENGADANGLDNEATFLPSKDGGFITSGYIDADILGTLTPMTCVNKFNERGTLQWSKKFTDYYIARIKETENHGFVFVMNGSEQNVLVVSTDSSGKTGGCKDAGFDVNVSIPDIKIAHPQNFIDSNLVVYASSHKITSVSLRPSKNTLCYKDCKITTSSVAADKTIEENNTSDLKTFPNPFTDIVHITFEAHEGAHTLIISDIQGKELLREKGVSKEGTNNLSLNLQHLSPGIYFLSIRTSKLVLVQKLMKQ